MTNVSRSIPQGLELLSTSHGIIIRKIWRSWKILPLAIFAAIWDSFLFFWYSQVITSHHAPLMAILFPIGHVAVGVGLTYYVVIAWINKTDVVVSASSVRVSSGPAPWVGNREVPTDQITDVVVRVRQGNRGRRTYEIMYVDPSRREKKLVSWLSEADQAEYIAATIRDTLALS